MPIPAKQRVDPVTSSVIQGALEGIAVEMGHKLMRMAHSSIIRESEDFGAAIIDGECRQLCESIHSTPLQSGPIPGYVKGIMRRLRERSEWFEAGDVIMHNDTYAGASHGPDVAFCVPVFRNGDLIAFSVTTAHHLDIGALTPGSSGIVDAMDAYAEGLQFRAVKVFERGRKNAQVWHLLRDNLRTSEIVLGDMEAQISASRIGAERYLRLIDRYGFETVEQACLQVMDFSETLMRQAIKAVPDGTYVAESYLDGYLDSDDRRKKDLKLSVAVTVDGSDLTVDLSGTSPQVSDRPINMPLEGTVDCAVWLTLKSILLDEAVHGPIPHNSGLVRPIRIVAPEGSLANPVFPAPTIARSCIGNPLADTVMKALAAAVPGQVSAGTGSPKGVAFTGFKDGRHWVHLEVFEGAYGGRNGKDGMDSVDTLYVNTRNNPIEEIESHLPLRVTRYELREDAIGAGQWRGGLGCIREFVYLDDGGVSVEGDGHKYPPWSLGGGTEGSTAGLVLEIDGIAMDGLPSKLPYKAVKAGTKVVVIGGSGGGFGDPLERDPQLVANDVIDGHIYRETAEKDYLVVVGSDGSVDEARTRELRDARQSPVRPRVQ